MDPTILGLLLGLLLGLFAGATVLLWYLLRYGSCQLFEVCDCKLDRGRPAYGPLEHFGRMSQATPWSQNTEIIPPHPDDNTQ